MNYGLFNQRRRRFICTLFLFALAFVAISRAQSMTTLTGTAMDAKGNAIANAEITITAHGAHFSRTVKTDAQGHYSIDGLMPGEYTLQASASGFQTTIRQNVQATGATQDLPITLAINNVVQQVTVEANDSDSVAAKNAPLDTLLSATSARSEISTHYIDNYNAPTADYGELTQMVPGAFTTNSNGVGLGQSSTSFRGFPDGEYDIDFDGIPFYDTNTPSHHSWAFFPSQWIGGIDFDRSPGTASTIGPTPFGGSIHLQSRDLMPISNVRGSVSYGSFNTFLFDGSYYSGNFGGAAKRSNLFVDVHHMSSDGYQTLNYQTRNAGSLKYQYVFSPRTVLTGYSGVIWLDANTPNLNSTRQQLLQFGPNYLLQGTDSTQANYYRFNYYHVPTDFEYVGIRSDMAHGWSVDFKPYTYNYDNSEFYAKQPKGGKPINAANCAPTGNPAISPCAVDKYNSYRKYGETGAVSQTSHMGILRAGFWYEWAKTNRHQTPSNPFTKVDDVLPNFNETYTTNSYQPYAEYEFRLFRKLTITPGVKGAIYTQNFTQFADNGGKIGSVNPITNKPFTSVTNSATYHSVLPSISANYRILSNLSVYGQLATGSVVPPTSVYDVAGGVVAVPPKPQKNTTIQTGTVLKLRRFTFDADYYHVRFQNGYSSATDTNPNDAQFGESINYISPSSVTQGVEGEGTYYFGSGLTLYLNATRGSATYVGTLTVYSPSSSTSNPVTVKAPSGLWVAGAPSDTEAEGLTYQRHGFDFGVFNKRVGSQWEDNGAYHNQQRIDPFSVSNLYLNYTVGENSRFAQTKIRFSVNNLMNSHNQTSDALGGSVTAATFVANGLKYTDPFQATTASSPGYTGGVNLADDPTLLPGRSYILSVMFGFRPRH